MGFFLPDQVSGFQRRDAILVAPKDVIRRTRAPEKAVVLMVEMATIVATGEA
jgi:hypothetical protein